MILFNKYIYLIRCPTDNAVIYVGNTITPKQRFYNHCNRNNSNAPIAEYIRKIRSLGFHPTMEIIEVISNTWTAEGVNEAKRLANDREVYFINKYYNDPQARILNIKGIKI